MFRRDGSALSDILGTIILLGVTVTVVSGVATQLSERIQSEPPVPPRLDVLVKGVVGERSLTVTHAGGAPLDRGLVTVQLALNDTERVEVDLGDAGLPFRAGDRVRIGPLPAALAPGARVDLALYVDGTSYGPVADARLQVGGAPVLPGASSMTLSVRASGPAGRTPVVPSSIVEISADVGHTHGRKAVREVVADLSPIDGPRSARLYDDGTHGDVVRGDGRHTVEWFFDSTRVRAPRTIVVTATDVGGATVSGSVLVPIAPYGLVYNTSLLENAAVRVLKFEGLGGGDEKDDDKHDESDDDEDDDDADGKGKPDRVTAHVKVRLVRDPILHEGALWTLNHVYLRFEPYACANKHGCSAGKPADKGAEPVEDADEDGDDDVEHDGGLYKADHKHKNLKAYGFHLGTGARYPGAGWTCSNAATGVRLFRAENVTIKRFDQDKTSLPYWIVLEWQEVGGRRIFEDTIEAATDDANFVLHRNERSDVIMDDGWPTKFENCTL